MVTHVIGCTRQVVSGKEWVRMEVLQTRISSILQHCGAFLITKDTHKGVSRERVGGNGSLAD